MYTSSDRAIKLKFLTLQSLAGALLDYDDFSINISNNDSIIIIILDNVVVIITTLLREFARVTLEKRQAAANLSYAVSLLSSTPHHCHIAYC